VRGSVNTDGQTIEHVERRVRLPGTDGHRLDGDPFQRKGLLKRIGPFAAVAFLAEVSIALPPGPSSSNYTILSAILFFATFLGCLAPWNRLPVAANVIVPLLYVASVLTLNLAAGGSTSGVGIVILVPLVWVALYHRPYQSGILVVAVVLYQLVTSLIPTALPGSVITRRLVFWFALSSLVSFATQQLRFRIRVMLDQRQDLIEQRESALAVMTGSFERLRIRDRESQLVIEMGEILQSGMIVEARDAVRDTLAQLFEGGAVNTGQPTGDTYQTTVDWGPDTAATQSFSRSECRALTSGHVHFSDAPDGPCGHRVDPNATVALCVPMIAPEDAVGVLLVYLYGAPTPPQTAVEARASLTQLAMGVAEQLGMALANYRLRDSLRELSIRDPLTNLFNRRYMEETFQRELSRAARDHVSIGVVQIDIDYFKEFNDRYGHDVGDALLKAFADLLLTSFRDSDVPCRYGGEEFTLILVNSTLDETEARARGLQRSVQDLRLDLGEGRTSPAPPTLSIGIASFPGNGESADSLMRAADQALYAAKSQGRNAIVRAIRVDAVSAE
jgi:diguanylate cyclase (GGDEF)-like protein